MMGNYYKYVDEKLSNNDKQLLQPLRNQKLIIKEEKEKDEEKTMMRKTKKMILMKNYHQGCH